MTTPAIAPDMNVPPEQSAVSRVINTFVTPSKAFPGLERKASSWWLPFLLLVIVSYAYVGLLDKKISFEKISENQIKLNQKAAERLEKLTPEQRQQQMDLSVKITKGISYTVPVFALAVIGIIALVLMATFNFGMGHNIRYSTLFAVSMFAHLPNVIKTVIMCIAIAAGLDPDGFDIRNPIATNLGAVVGHGNAALWSLASSIDIFNIWILILTAIGISTVSRVKRGTAFGVVFGWWIVVTLFGVGWAAIFG
jgi:hypothetical protein